MTKQSRPLTNQESAFAAEHHYYIYSFLQANDLPEDDYYDVAVFGYLDAVRSHFSNGTGDFKQTAFAQMLSACNAYDEAQAMSVSFVDIGRPIEDIIADVKDTAEDAIRAIALEQTLASFSEAEKAVVELLLAEYPKPDIAAMLGISMEALSDRIAVIQRKTAASPLMAAA